MKQKYNIFSYLITFSKKNNYLSKTFNQSIWYFLSKTIRQMNCVIDNAQEKSITIYVCTIDLAIYIPSTFSALCSQHCIIFPHKK